MEWVAMITAVAVLQCALFSVVVGRARVKYQIRAPAVQGHEMFERCQRAHGNTVEQLVLFLPGLWLFGWYLEPRAAAALGLLFVVGRQLYFNAYLDQPRQRGRGFLLGFLASIALLLGGLGGALAQLILNYR
ncbi:MAPEG family protein [Alloalcanivorax gelatiniphagus]|uniref:MAPEG family protein n=1 Tax=Alloalcanivorax gelatiniphagus TaxID=1194167 RepID=A0ABY2XRI3_9GAMM|nr:MAPEG family protein [Alloalcanivorax gelatiniphagus]TMW14976.1 MAPEG family protein [Alloalcanivorax gelatiniphagus]|tara:strand:- start:12893 stop:13288 length:396 start_codon:yes stop_codon:yes gene_type:complete